VHDMPDLRQENKKLALFGFVFYAPQGELLP
jgi:hypothetical protein